jgi:hypothetical protein
MKYGEKEIEVKEPDEANGYLLGFKLSNDDIVD